MFSCNLIGAGKLGRALMIALSSVGNIQLSAVYSRSYTKAQALVHELNQGIAVQQLDKLPRADITFITTTDDAIPIIVSQLAAYSTNGIVVHCSGALTSAVLLPLAPTAAIGSIHPLKSFTALIDAQALLGCHCFAEGHSAMQTIIKPLFENAGAIVHGINASKKTEYHAGAVIASNYLVTLFAGAEQLLQQAGIEKEISRLVIHQLMQGTLNNVQQASDTAAVLTGPVSRGDKATVENHLMALQNTEAFHLYKTLAKSTLLLTRLSEPQKQKMEAILV